MQPLNYNNKRCHDNYKYVYKYVQIQLSSYSQFPTLIFMRPIDLLSLNMTKIKLGFTGFLQQGQVSCLKRICMDQTLMTIQYCTFYYNVQWYWSMFSTSSATVGCISCRRCGGMQLLLDTWGPPGKWYFICIILLYFSSLSIFVP